MDDRIPGMDAPTIESQDAMNLLSSAAEHRAFKRFQFDLATTTGEVSAHDSALDVWLRDHSALWRRRRELTAAQMQAEEIRKFRWLESEKIRCDIGKVAHVDWITLHAADWRQWFEDHYDGPLVECD